MTRISFAVVIINDNVLEGDEKFNLVIVINSFFPSHRVTASNPDHVTVTIYDDDGKFNIKLVCYSYTSASSGTGTYLNMETNNDPKYTKLNTC